MGVFLNWSQSFFAGFEVFVPSLFLLPVWSLLIYSEFQELLVWSLKVLNALSSLWPVADVLGLFSKFIFLICFSFYFYFGELATTSWNPSGCKQNVVHFHYVVVTTSLAIQLRLVRGQSLSWGCHSVNLTFPLISFKLLVNVFHEWVGSVVSPIMSSEESLVTAVGISLVCTMFRGLTFTST